MAAPSAYTPRLSSSPTDAPWASTSTGCSLCRAWWTRRPTSSAPPAISRSRGPRLTSGCPSQSRRMISRFRRTNHRCFSLVSRTRTMDTLSMTSDLGVNIWTILPNSNDTLIIFIADIHHSTSRKTNTHEKTENLTVTKPLPSPQTLLLTANDKDQNWSTSVMLGQCRNTSLT